MLRFERISRSAGAKKWVSVAAAADYGNSQALWVPPTTPWTYGISVGSASLQNRSGGDVKAGLAGRYATSVWGAGQVDSAGAYTADDDDAHDEGTGDFSMHDRSDSGSGFLVSCDRIFNILGIVQSAAGDQTTPVKLVEYWNGTSWVDIVAALFIDDTLIGNGTGEKVLCWPALSDWVVGGDGDDVPAARYNLRVRHTHGGAGSANPVASQLFVGWAEMMLEAIVDNAISSLVVEGETLQFPPQCEALFPVFSTASRLNTVTVGVRAY